MSECKVRVVNEGSVPVRLRSSLRDKTGNRITSPNLEPGQWCTVTLKNGIQLELDPAPIDLTPPEEPKL